MLANSLTVDLTFFLISLYTGDKEGCMEIHIGDILGKVRSPLGFFTLALLIVEGIIGIIAFNAGLESLHMLIALGMMVAVFLVVVALVAWITFSRPGNLQEDVTTLQDILTSAGFRDAVEDLVLEKLASASAPPSGVQE